MASRHPSRLRPASERTLRTGGSLPPEGRSRVPDVAAKRTGGRSRRQGPRQEDRRKPRRIRADRKPRRGPPAGDEEAFVDAREAGQVG